MTDPKPVYHLTVESLAADGADLPLIEDWFESEVERLDRGFTYDDLLDVLERDRYWDGTGERGPLDFGTSTDSPVYRRLLAIARRIRRETR